MQRLLGIGVCMVTEDKEDKGVLFMLRKWTVRITVWHLNQ